MSGTEIQTRLIRNGRPSVDPKKKRRFIGCSVSNETAETLEKLLAQLRLTDPNISMGKLVDSLVHAASPYLQKNGPSADSIQPLGPLTLPRREQKRSVDNRQRKPK